MIEQHFKKLSASDGIRTIIQSAFTVDLDISGGWGYSQEDALIIHDRATYPLTQLQHTLASMHAHLQMQMTLPKETRFGAINLNEIKREQIKSDIRIYDIITFQITGILESTYASLIEEYKQNQENKDFDVAGHFQKRKEATLVREETIWFDVTEVIS